MNAKTVLALMLMPSYLVMAATTATITQNASITITPAATINVVGDPSIIIDPKQEDAAKSFNVYTGLGGVTHWSKTATTTLGFYVLSPNTYDISVAISPLPPCGTQGSLSVQVVQSGWSGGGTGTAVATPVTIGTTNKILISNVKGEGYNIGLTYTYAVSADPRDVGLQLGASASTVSYTIAPR